MLLQFNFKNFRSFKDDTILDLTVQKNSDASDSFFSFGNESVLPIIAVYGANACGKSNLYRAFEFMSKYVALSFMYGVIVNQPTMTLLLRYIFLYQTVSLRLFTIMVFVLINIRLLKSGLIKKIKTVKISHWFFIGVVSRMN